MGHEPSSYDADILLWSEHQAALLRGLARGAAAGAALPNDLDLENIAEEIEAVGRSEQHAVESHLVVMLEHLMKAASSPQAPPVRKWLREVRTARAGARRAFTPGMRRKLDLDALWREARAQAADALGEYDEVLAPLPEANPFSLDELLDDTREPAGYVAALRALDATP